jgi:hypothetical protein
MRKLVLRTIFFYTFTKHFKATEVKNRFSFKSQSFRKAMLLMGVYMLHLVFLQALMQAAPSYNIDNSFKPLFNTNQTKHANHSIPAAKHPAVAYYTMLMKQGNDVGGVCSHVTPAVHELEAAVTPFILAITFHINQTSVGQLHLADDIFKVYRLIQVFLI